MTFCVREIDTGIEFSLKNDQLTIIYVTLIKETAERRIMEVNINFLRQAFSKSWSRKTSYPKTRDQWSPENPAFGQCAVTSLIVQDLFGGKLVYNKDYHHYWNILDDGTTIDLTKIQFGKNVKIDNHELVTREYILESAAAARAETPERYALLKQKVEKLLFVETEK